MVCVNVSQHFLVNFKQWGLSPNCLPCGRNLLLMDITKCYPSFQVEKNFEKSAKTSKTPWCLGGAGGFWKTRAKQ